MQERLSAALGPGNGQRFMASKTSGSPDRRARCQHRAAAMDKETLNLSVLAAIHKEALNLSVPAAMRKRGVQFVESRRDEGIAPYTGQLHGRSFQGAILLISLPICTLYIVHCTL